LAAVYARPNAADEQATVRLAHAARSEVAATLPRRTRVLAWIGWGWWRGDPASRAERRVRAVPRVTFR